MIWYELGWNRRDEAINGAYLRLGMSRWYVCLDLWHHGNVSLGAELHAHRYPGQLLGDVYLLLLLLGVSCRIEFDENAPATGCLTFQVEQL